MALNKDIRDLPVWTGTVPANGILFFYDPDTDREYRYLPAQAPSGLGDATLFNANRLRGADKKVDYLQPWVGMPTWATTRSGLAPESLVVGTRVRVNNPATPLELQAGQTASPAVFVLVAQSGNGSVFGFWNAGGAPADPAQNDRVLCEWYPETAPQAQYAAYRSLDRTIVQNTGWEVKYEGSDSIIRLFVVKHQLFPSGSPALVPEPPLGGEDANYKEISPSTGTTYLPTLSVSLSLAQSTMAAHTLEKAKRYDIYNFPGGEVQVYAASNRQFHPRGVRLPTASTIEYGTVDVAAGTFTVDTGVVIANDSITNNMLATDVKVGSLAALTTTIKTSVVAAINELKALTTTIVSNIGTLASLSTTAKGNLVAAINEVFGTVSTNTANISTNTAAIAKYDPAFSAAPAAVSGTVTLATGGKLNPNYTMPLAANTTLAITGAVSGATGIILITHDATATVYTLTPPANSKGSYSVGNTANAVTELSWLYDGTYFYWASKTY